jgi:hypothetical protein
MNGAADPTVFLNHEDGLSDARLTLIVPLQTFVDI